MSRLTLRLLKKLVAPLLAACLVAVFAQCGSAATRAEPDTPAVAAAEQVAPIVGRWEQLHTCKQLVDALDALGLGALAPAVVGDYFPDQTYDELVAKNDLCSGAKPQLHDHFFTADGLFGSLDQHENQVDDGTYTVVDSNTFQIGDATFDFDVQGDTLTMTPNITEKQRRAALRHPEEFTTAGWMVAVSYPGTKWKKVPCQGWC